MNKLSIFATIFSLLSLSNPVQAKPLIECIIPESPDINYVLLDLEEEPSRDYLTFVVSQSKDQNDPESQDQFLFSISQAGTVNKQIESGGFNALVFSEQFQKIGNVLLNAGFFAIQKAQAAEDGTQMFTGFLSYNKNIYLLACAKVK